MNVVMTGVTHHQRLASARGHDLNPPRFRVPAIAAQIPEVPDVMDFDPVLRSAEFAGVCQQALEEFRAMALHLRRLVAEDSALPSLQRNAAPGGYQRLLAFATFNHDLEPLTGAAGRLQPGSVAAPLFDDTRPVLAGERAQQRRFHHPA